MLLRELFESRILLEYDRSKTASIFGNKLVNALLQDRGRNQPLASIRNQISTGEQVPGDVIIKVADIILEFIEGIDPTSHNEYSRWLATVYSNQGVTLEDLSSKGKDWLSAYHTMKTHRILPAEYKDIGKISFTQLGDIVLNPSYQEKLNGAQVPVEKGQSKVIFKDSDLTVIQPEDKASACYYGQGTKWCTAATNNNMFDTYAEDGSLYILIPKNPKYVGEKYQLHFETAQFMDETDEHIDIVDMFNRRFPQLKKVFNDYRYVFSARDWFGNEEVGSYHKKYHKKFEDAITEKYKQLSKIPVDQLIDVPPEIIAKVPHMEEYIKRLLTEGFLARKVAAVVTTFAMTTDPHNLETAINAMEQHDQNIEEYEVENGDSLDEKSIWNSFRNVVAKALWDQWLALSKVGSPNTYYKNQFFSKLLLKAALEAVDGVEK